MSVALTERQGDAAVPPPPSRRRHLARWIAGAVVIVAVALAVFAATRPSYQATQLASPLVGKRAPAFSTVDLGGQHVSLASLRGRYVYVNFFASWCPPCQAEEPNLVTFAFQQQREGAKGAALVSVVYDDSDSAAARFARSEGQDWPTVPDPGGAVANAYGVTSPPMTFLVDPRGVVVGAWAGPVRTSTLDNLLATARRGRA